MTESTNGETSSQDAKQSLTLEQRMENLEKRIEQYTNSLSLPNSSKATMDEIEDLLNKSRSDMVKMTQEEAATSAIFLYNFNYYLQRALNKEQRIVSYCQECISKTIVNRVSQQHGSSYLERVALATVESEYATKLDTLRVLALMRIKETDYLVNRLDSVAGAYKQFAMVRRGQN